MTGKTFGRLTVLEQADDRIRSNGIHDACWLCECSCKNHTIKSIAGYLLKNGSVKSCGCLQKESEIKNGKRNHKTNVYDLNDEYGIGWTFNTNKMFYFDLTDYDLIKNYCWFEHCNQKTKYSRLQAYDASSKKAISMSELLGYKKYDHINRNPFDNRKKNFRPATCSENTRNRSLPRNNSSGVIGVSWHKGSQKWMSRIEVNKKSIYLGKFVDKNKAVIARLYAEAKYFGDFAPQRHLFEQYGIKIDNEEGINE